MGKRVARTGIARLEMITGGVCLGNDRGRIVHCDQIFLKLILVKQFQRAVHVHTQIQIQIGPR